MGPAGVWTLATWVPCPLQGSESSGLQVRERAQGDSQGHSSRPPTVGGPHILTRIREAASSHALSCSP